MWTEIQKATLCMAEHRVDCKSSYYRLFLKLPSVSKALYWVVRKNATPDLFHQVELGWLELGSCFAIV